MSSKNHFDTSYYQKFEKKNKFHTYLLSLIDRKGPIFFYLLAQKKPKAKLLDIGCGDAKFLQHVQNHFACLGVDTSTQALKLAKKKAPKASFKKLSIYDLKKLPDQEFDIITCFDVLEHVTNHTAIFSQMHRILKPSGKLIVSFPNASSLMLRRKLQSWECLQDSSHIYLLSAQDWEQRLRTNGLLPVKRWMSGFLNPIYKHINLSLFEKLFLQLPTQILFVFGFPLPVTWGDVAFIAAIKNPHFKNDYHLEQEKLSSTD
ncbi:class I SAM-dependent methyltransferase [Candidatus Beckwithbacteria bacterium]|nr:class I SAM-dependent methyltransferase [Candidatus Beckwithbacteria bacterium]